MTGQADWCALNGVSETRPAHLMRIKPCIFSLKKAHQRWYIIANYLSLLAQYRKQLDFSYQFWPSHVFLLLKDVPVAAIKVKDAGVLVMISAARVLAIDLSTQCDVLTLVMMNRDCTQTTSVVNVVCATLNVSTAVMARCSTSFLTRYFF